MTARVLHGITWDHPRAYLPLDAASAAYAQATGVQVVWDRRSLKEFGDRSIESLAREYDLLVIDHPHVGIAADANVLVPLDDYLDQATLGELAQNSLGGSHASYFLHDHQWALAIDAACQVAAIRPDLLLNGVGSSTDPSNVWPDTWDAAFVRAEALREHDLWLGMALCPTDCVCSFLTLMVQAGTPLSDGNDDLPLQAVVNVLKLLQKIAAIAHPRSTSWNPIQLYETMSAENEIAYSPLAFGYSNYTDPGFRPAALSYGPIPGRSGSLLGGAGIAVSQLARDREQTVSFAAYLASAKCQSGEYLRSGGQPAHVSAWRLSGIGPRAAFFHGTLSTLEAAHTRPRHAAWPEFQPLAGDLIHEFITAGKDATSTARQISDRYSTCNRAR